MRWPARALKSRCCYAVPCRGAVAGLLGLGLIAASDAASPPVAESPAQILARMSLVQKVAQMIQPEIRWVTPEDVRRFGFGSILNGGGSPPGEDRHATVADWLALAERYHAASLDRSQGSAGVPIIWGTDAVHGHAVVHGATVFPHNIGLGATRNPALVRAIAAATAREVRATGLDWIFAPTVAVATDLRWGRLYESFSADPHWVARLGAATVAGIQDEGLAATAKHFIGDGGTAQGIDQGDVALPLADLLKRHGAGYRAAIDAGVLAVMASYNSWHGNKVHGQRALLHGVLRESMGFSGVVISDWDGVEQVAGCAKDNCAQAINAGIDIVMVPREWRPFLHNTVEAVRLGVIPQARIDEAVLRILGLKVALGLLDGTPPAARRRGADAATVGAAAHRALAAQAVRESLVLLKNNRRLLPLDAAQRVLVTGSAADDIGRQSGGWTLTWQGGDLSNGDFPGASSVYDGIRREVEAAGGSAELSPDGSFTESPDVAVVVFGEMPYAEGEGDVPHLNHGLRYPRDRALLRKLASAGIPVVSVFIGGRPVWINPELNASDALVVAWLPGSEGHAVADLLFRPTGSAGQREFTGKLPMPWPARDLNPDDARMPVTEVLFPLGYGLTLQDDETLPRLSERSFLPVPSAAQGIETPGKEDR